MSLSRCRPNGWNTLEWIETKRGNAIQRSRSVGVSLMCTINSNGLEFNLFKIIMNNNLF